MAVALAALAAACIPYRPAPLVPAALGAAFSTRRLDEPGLVRFLAARGVSATDSGWRPRNLGLAAIYFHPVLDEARAALAATRAAEITAGARPYPDVRTGAGFATSTATGESPWTVMLAAGLTLETGGKRSARRARSLARSLASTLRLRASTWKVAIAAEAAGVAALVADGGAADARLESEAVAQLLTLLRARYAEGSITLADVAQVEAELQAAVVARTDAERARTAARASLAGALAVPVDEALTVAVANDTAGACAVLDTLDHRRLQSFALRRRDDVGALLADYAAAEADVRVEVARQHPDVQLGPGIAWDQGVVRWTLGLALPSVALNRNRGPIAEAEAQRAGAAARFEATQQLAIREVGAARLDCAGARDLLAAADSLIRGTEERLRLSAAAYSRGETGATETAFARLALIRAARAQRAARRQVELAGIAFEQALGGWLAGPPFTAADIERSPRSSETRP